MNIAIAGAGYVGLSLGVHLAQDHRVTVVDIDADRIRSLKNGISPFRGNDWKSTFENLRDNLSFTTQQVQAYETAEFVFVATPTEYDPQQGALDTTSILDVVETVRSVNSTATIIIRSTVPIGFTLELSKRFSTGIILFSPEFLREDYALEDILNPSRIILGIPTTQTNDEGARKQANILLSILAGKARNDAIPKFIMSSDEAEAVKLFSNAYLALRVAYFNELDNFALLHELDAKAIIKGVCADERIGDYYNNPSFGYGGHCLPKDVKQLEASLTRSPHQLIAEISRSNITRKDCIAKQIRSRINDLQSEGIETPILGIYGLNKQQLCYKQQESPLIDIIKQLNDCNVHFIAYVMDITSDAYCDIEIFDDLNDFKMICNIIVADRYNDELTDVKSKVFTRDLSY